MTDPLPRITTGISGLDTILCGGLIEGASYIIQGPPGAGKTVLSNQVAFAQAAAGHKVLYVTLLAETHDRLFQSLSTLTYFDRSKLGSTITYLSVFQTLRDEGLSAVVKLIRGETARRQATLLVFDGLLNARDHAESNIHIKTFVAEVQSQAAFVGCTVLFLTSTRLADDSPEHTMVDGVIDLTSAVFGVREQRHLQVLKSRGSRSIGGLHAYEITEVGVTAFPRLEALSAAPPDYDDPDRRAVPSGINGLDDVIQGGYPSRSVTLLLGPSGAGKTSIGLSFLAAAEADEPALYFGFYESGSRLLAKSGALGLGIRELVNDGRLEIMWQPLSENILDKLGHRLLEAVRRRRVKRLVIDALGGFERAAVYRERLVEFFASLANELRTEGVTTIATWELHGFLGQDPNAPTPEILSTLDNLMLLRTVPVEQKYKRVLSVLKMRDCAIEPAMHEVVFGPSGLRVIFGQLPARESALSPDPGRGN